MRELALAWGLVLATAGLVPAQQVEVVPAQQVEVVSAPADAVAPGALPASWRVGQLIGSNVALQGNENYGKIEDIVMEPNGTIGYLVVSNGGRYAMLPWNTANINYGQRIVTYNVAPQAIQPLFFERTAWPNLGDQAYSTRIRQVFPNAGVIRREVIRSAPGALTPPVEVREKVKVKPNGDIKVKEKVR